MSDPTDMRAEVLAKAIYDAMVASDDSNMFGSFSTGKSVCMDGYFDLIDVSRRLLANVDIDGIRWCAALQAIADHPGCDDPDVQASEMMAIAREALQPPVHEWPAAATAAPSQDDWQSRAAHPAVVWATVEEVRSILGVDHAEDDGAGDERE